MSYVRANTAPTFGMRSQAIQPSNQNLGTYLRASFPLPTTGMSKPINGLNGAFYDGPYPRYARIGLAGEYVAPRPGESSPTFASGAVTYHIDPRTGQYRFFTTDVLPRGVFAQNVFQHPMKPALSALGVPVSSRGTTMVKLPNGRCIVMKTSPSCSMNCKCKCRGRCKSGMGLGADTFTDPATGCITDADGNLLSCPGGVDPNFTIGTQVAQTTGAPALPQLPTVAEASPGIIQSIVNAFKQPAVVSTPGIAPVAPASSVGSFFSGSTNILGANVPNSLLTLGGVLLLGGAIGGGRRR